MMIVNIAGSRLFSVFARGFSRLTLSREANSALFGRVGKALVLQSAKFTKRSSGKTERIFDLKALMAGAGAPRRQKLLHRRRRTADR
jgi:hypothetical protein